MSTFITSIVYNGIYPDVEQSEIKKIKLLNIFGVIRIALSFFFLTEDYFVRQFPFYYSLLAHGTISVLAIVAIALQHFRKYNFARLLFLIMLNIELYLFAFVLQPGMQVEYFFILVPLVSLLFFDALWIHILFLVIASTLFSLPTWLTGFEESDVLPISSLCLFVTVFIIVNYFKNLNQKNELLLEEQRNEAVKSNRLISIQKKELEEVHQYQHRFFTNIVHEIRTPITIIKGTLFQFFSEKETKISAHQLQLKSNFDSQLERLERIVEDVIDLSKLSSNTFTLTTEKVNISQLVHKTYRLFQSSFFNKKINYHYKDASDENIFIEGNQTYLERSINNILNNALKYTDPEGSVDVNIETDKSKNEVLLTIKDSGIGISDEHASKIFDQFYQVDNSINKAGGSGVGLAFSKEIIELHKGFINVKSGENEGTSFIIRLPITEKAQLIYEEEFTFKDSKGDRIVNIENKPTILLVEDQPEIQELLTSLFSEYHCISANNGLEGLEALKQNAFDIIITDYMMPQMNGMEFIKKVKALKINTPIIVLTAVQDLTTKFDILELGVDDYLIKPFEPKELIARVSNSISNHKSRVSFQEDIQETIDQSSGKKLLYQIKEYIEMNCFTQTINVEVLCEQFALSPSTLYRKVKVASGLGTKDFITEIRLSLAHKIKQQSPDITNTKLAEQVGWTNPTHFAKLYSDRFGVELN